MLRTLAAGLLLATASVAPAQSPPLPGQRSERSVASVIPAIDAHSSPATIQQLDFQVLPPQ